MCASKWVTQCNRFMSERGGAMIELSSSSNRKEKSYIDISQNMKE